MQWLACYIDRSITRESQSIDHHSVLHRCTNRTRLVVLPVLVVGVMVLVDQRSCSATAIDGVVGLLSSILSVFTMSLKVDSYTLLRP